MTKMKILTLIELNTVNLLQRLGLGHGKSTGLTLFLIILEIRTMLGMRIPY